MQSERLVRERVREREKRGSEVQEKSRESNSNMMRNHCESNKMRPHRLYANLATNLWPSQQERQQQ